MLPYVIVFLATIGCCLIFEKIGLSATVKKLLGSYQSQLQAMKNPDLTDEEKQKALLKQVGTQLRLLLKLIGSILLFVSPFILYVLLAPYTDLLNTELLYEPLGIGITFVAAILYIIFRKNYGRLFGK